MSLQVCATHAIEWDRDGIILSPSEVVDGDGHENGCVECARGEDAA
jgi:hypothetical protein